MIAWFPKAFTGGCTKECKAMAEQGEEIRKFDVAYFTASVDEADQNKKFAESLSLDYPILSDPSKETAKAYGVLNERGMANRWTYYIDKNGKIAAVEQKVNVENHGKEIAAKLELSANTVAVHRANIMNTLGVHKTAELVVYALQNGLVNPL